MASYPITSLHIDGETMETVTDSIFLGSKIIADAECSNEFKKMLVPQDQELTVAQNMNSLLPNSDLNLGKRGKPLDHSGIS